MGNPQPVKRLNDVHIQMCDYIMANPGCTYDQVAAVIGYSIGWISQIYNSDAFQAMLRERQIEVFGDLKLTIKERVTGLAHASLKRLEEKIPVEQDVDKVANVADLALKALGFGAHKGVTQAQGAPGQQTNVFIGTTDKATLEAARSLMHQPRLPEKVINPAAGGQESPSATSE